MQLRKKVLVVGFIGLSLISCKKNKVDKLEDDFRSNYADMVYANYEDAYNEAQELKTTIDAFIAAPSESGLAACKQAWLDAREPYGQTETFRFSGGPIDDENGPEGNLNAWPLDEGYIDYVEGAPTSGIINDLSKTIDEATLRGLNEEGGEKNISIGYHAIEFLLWGQDDPNTTLKTPGNRPYTDFVSSGGTAENQIRRGEYLKICAQLLVDDLATLLDEWKEGGSYRTTFLAADEDEITTQILTGMGVLAKSELAGERVFVALDNQDQEDEHSCFSDNTHRDIILNFEGIYNVYQGKYTRVDGSVVDGTGFDDVLYRADKKLKEKLDEAFLNAQEAVEAIPTPFDYALTLETPGEEGPINQAVAALQELGDLIAEAGSEIGLTINTALPE